MKTSSAVKGRPISEKLNRSVLVTLLCIVVMSLFVLAPFEYRMYHSNRDYALDRLKKGIQSRLLAIAQSAAMQIDVDTHYDLLGEKPDWNTPGFQKIKAKLREVQEVHGIQDDLYTLRLKDREKRLATFIVMSGEENYIGNDYVYL